MIAIGFAFVSAVFAALTAILAKIGMTGINSTLATAIRTMVVLVMSWGMVFLTGTQTGVADFTSRNWLFLILSGLATGASWLCYFKALQIGVVAQVVAIDKFSIVLTILMAALILHEGLTVKMILGTALITAGTFVMIL
jgi:transporter family protein